MEERKMGCVLSDGTAGSRFSSTPTASFFAVSLLVILVVIASAPGCQCWSKEGHIMTCRIAQGLLEPAAAHAVRNLLPEYVKGDLSALCVWPDQVRDCHDPHGTPDMCVAGAIHNYTSQLMHYNHGTSDRRYNLTEALLFLSHFMGDIHQPMHVGFTSDEGGNTIDLRWFKHKSNLHHVWDREIILTALADYYGKSMEVFQADIETNFTSGIWSEDVSSWGDCDSLFSCPKKYASESISLACKWGYKGVRHGDILADDYFNSRLPIVTRRIAQGGVRLAMALNRVFGEHNQEIPPPT
ncbi:hypothetical protein Taro_012560 [Colocasia esculenta]|uniref:Aspergillus nuclease S1 n=1 Tax=Colocasia esculenta TaxID=4460 RepID=A0A843U9F7_COLES|nr:hypothetical protein [Colocasia esculenta]